MPLNSLLCRHDYFWSERHRSDRCRRCGRMRAAADVNPGMAETVSRPITPPKQPVLDAPATVSAPAVRPRIRSSDKALKAQARARRTSLLDSLERLADGDELTRREVVDAVMAVIEDAHSADPVLFGPEAVARFARLHEAREALAGADWCRLQGSNPRHPVYKQHPASSAEGFV